MRADCLNEVKVSRRACQIVARRTPRLKKLDLDHSGMMGGGKQLLTTRPEI